MMAKASRAGRTKTRLSPPLAPDEAARLNTAFLRDGAENLIAAGRLASCRGYMAYGPPGEEAFFGFLPPGIGLVEAWAPTLGESLIKAMTGILAEGHASGCLINADSPTLPPALLAEAAEALAGPGERVVLGPSTDGGYYLIGMKHLHIRLFEDIAWSTAQVTRQTCERAAEIGLPVTMLAPWYDIDDAASLAMLRDELAGRPFDPGRPPAAARHTRALLAEIDAPR